MVHLILLSPYLPEETVPKANLIIREEQEYLNAYQQIISAIYAGQDYYVLIKNRTVGRWLSILAKRYGKKHVSFVELNVHQQLSKQLGVEVPSTYSEKELVEAGLLDVFVPARPGIRFEDHLLEIFFTSYLVPDKLRLLVDWVGNVVPQDWQTALARPLLKEIFQKRVAELRQILSEQNRFAELQLLEWLVQSPQTLYRNLVALKLLKNYPSDLGKRVFGKIYDQLRELKLDDRKLPVKLSGLEEVSTEIQHYLNNVSLENSQDYERVYAQVSGYLEAEFDTLYRWLGSGKFEVTEEMIRKFRDKFYPLVESPRQAQAMADLDLLLSKPFPQEPNNSWEAQQWLEWALEEYFPYRFWSETTGQLDEKIVEYVGKYSDWLYQNYGKLLYNSDLMGWRAVLKLKDEIKNHPSAVLVVMVDNLGVKFYPILRQQLQKQGFYQSSLRYCFSALPSCTEVSKKCLILGSYSPFPEDAYQARVEQYWSKVLSCSVKYLANVGELRSISKREHDVYFLNYLPLDIALHQSEKQMGISHTQMAQAYLASLALDIFYFSRRINAERELMVIILSDHGSTRIPEGEINVIQHKFYAQRAIDERHRYLAITDAEMKRLPKNVDYECYLLDGKLYDLGKNYLIAKRFYRFRPTDESIYVHGGLTPEETIIPIAIYQPAIIVPKTLKISITGKNVLHIGTKIELPIEIANPNDYAFEQVKIENLTPDLEIEQQEIPEIPPLKRIQSYLNGYCPTKTDTSLNEIILRVSYHFLEQPREQIVRLPIQIERAVKLKFDLRNL